jgi:hypothetical protein
MHWKRREYKSKGVYYKYSLSKKLRNQNRSSEEFEFMLNKLTLEELIALKLEICSKSINGKLSGMKLWKSIPYIAKKALILYSMSITNTRYEAASAIGLSFSTYLKALEKYDDEELQMLKKQFQEEKN